MLKKGVTLRGLAVFEALAATGSVAEAAQATGGKVASDWQATGVSIDTRTLQPGDLFVALKDVRDGHDFVADALAKGAAAALVSRVPGGVDPKRLLIVDEIVRAQYRPRKPRGYGHSWRGGRDSNPAPGPVTR